MVFHLAKDKRKTAILAGVIGNVIEWYDFALYGFMASIIASQFFPNESQAASLIATYGIFAAGFVMRPIGSVFFGRMGDTIGRSRTMLISVIMMAIPTFCLGLLPTYDKVGLLAPILLVTVRLLQGLSVGGEFSSSATYLVETSPANQRGLSGSWANFGSTVGVLIGSGLATLVLNVFSQTFLLGWGWRLPFLFGGVLGVIAILLRRHLPQSEHFLKFQKESAKQSPVNKVLHQGRKETTQGFFLAAAYGVIYYSSMVYLPTWISTQTAIPLKEAMLVNTITSIIIVPLLITAGWISDRYIRRTRFIALSLGACAALAIPALYWLNTDSIMAVITCQIIFGIFMAIPLGVAPATFVELFPTTYRLTGYSISFNLGMGVVGGTAPMVMTWLIDKTGADIMPGVYMLFWGIIAVITLLRMQDRSREALR